MLQYEQRNLIESFFQPNTEKKNTSNAVYYYFERALFQRALSVLKFNLPNVWRGEIKDYFLYCLFKYGYVCVFNDIYNGLTFAHCTLEGYSIYYQPTRVIVANPYLPKIGSLNIGSDTELLKLTPDYQGVWDIISFYAMKFASLNSSLDMTIENAKIAYVLGAKTKSGAEALKKIVDKINNGQSTVVYDKIIDCDVDKEPFVAFDRKSVKDSYMGLELHETYRNLLKDFDTEIGIPTSPSEKKERLITSEVEVSLADGVSRSLIWLETFNESAKKVNDMFLTDIRAEKREFEMSTNGQNEKKRRIM